MRTLEELMLGDDHARAHVVKRRIARRTTRLPAARRRVARRMVTGASAAEVGRWEAPFSLPVHAVHSVVLPTGEVMFWSSPFYSRPDPRPYETHAWLWNPREGTGPAAFTDVSPPASEGTPHAVIFCSGGSLLADGQVLAVGGTLYWPSAARPRWAGTKEVWTFDPWTRTWQRQPDTARGRWYPSQELLPDGRTLILGGLDESGTQAVNDDLEVFTPPAERGGVGTIERVAGGDRSVTPYPHLFTMPTGEVLLSGPLPYDSALITPTSHDEALDVPRWKDVRDAATAHRGGNAILEPAGPQGSTRVTQIGGLGPMDPATRAEPPIHSTETFDTSSGGTWEARPPLNIARSHHNSVVLPDASVVAVGGGNGTNPQDEANAEWPDLRSLQVEIRDPETSTWRLGPAQTVTRGYHSTAVLLPDGRVFSAGDNRPARSASDTGEAYSPPYLFRGPRPRIDSAPAEARWGWPLPIAASGATAERAVLMAPSAVTHGTEMHAKRIELSVAERGADGLTVIAPPNANVAQPGWYMLFLLSADGVPSIARWIRLHADAELPPAVATPSEPSPRSQPDPAIDPDVTGQPPPGFGTETLVSISPRDTRARSRIAAVKIVNHNSFDARVRVTLAIRRTRAASRAVLPAGRAGWVRVRLTSGQFKALERRGYEVMNVSARLRDSRGTQRTIARAVNLIREP